MKNLFKASHKETTTMPIKSKQSSILVNFEQPICFQFPYTENEVQTYLRQLFQLHRRESIDLQSKSTEFLWVEYCSWLVFKTTILKGTYIPACIYLFKIKNSNSRKNYESSSKFTINRLERRLVVLRLNFTNQ